jgi:ankyrin repeat protein
MAASSSDLMRGFLHAATSCFVVAALATSASAQSPYGFEADGTTMLHKAVVADDLSQVTRLVRGGAKVGAATRYGVTPLLLAVVNGNKAVVDLLLASGADPNTVSGEGETVLMSASRAGHVRIVEGLLARGADPNARERWRGQTALMWAAGENHPAVVTVLLRHGADPNLTGDALDFWSMVPSEPATPKIVMARGGMTALHYAARQGALESVRALVGSPEIDLNQQDPDGISALLFAALNGHFDVSAYLLEKGAGATIADRYGRTILFAALQMNRPDREPRQPARSDDTITAFHLARLALLKGADVDSVITGRLPGRCTQGCQPAAPEGATPLWRAARVGDVEGVRLMLDAGADARAAARDGSTPLMMAAGISWREERGTATEEESIAVIRMLLARGADIGERNFAGETALHGAAGRGAAAVIKFLVASGADLSAKDSTNRTPLHVAMGISDTQLRLGGGAAMDVPVREKAVQILRELMEAGGVAIEPYTWQTRPGRGTYQ